MIFQTVLVAFLAQSIGRCNGLTVPTFSRRDALRWTIGVSGAGWVGKPAITSAAEGGDVDVDSYLRTGMVAMPMGVSGQAGKGKPETGVVLRDGTEVNRDPKSRNVFSELLVKSQESGDFMAVAVTFESPWSLATGGLFDVETRDANTGDGAFLAVTSDVKGKPLGELKDSFFTDALFAPKGRFSFYGQPTDIKVKKGVTTGDYRSIDISFSTLSQSTMSEIPRKAKLVATIPSGSSQAIMLIGSASASRWKKGSEQEVTSVVNSFRAVPAPKTSMKLKPKDRFDPS